MNNAATQQSLLPPACELRARVTSLPILRLNRADHAAIVADLDDLIARAPGMLREASVLLEPVDIDPTSLDLVALGAALRDRDVFPAALCSDDADWRARATAQGMGLLAAQQSDAVSTTQKAAPTSKPGLIVDKPVRSGQQLYAQGRDLIVVGAVSAGAEVIADGNVHIHGPMRGRAIAGAQGDIETRVFCSQLDAELVAVAGCYCTNEQLPDSARGGAAQVRLIEDRLTVESLRG